MNERFGHHLMIRRVILSCSLIVSSAVISFAKNVCDQPSSQYDYLEQTQFRLTKSTNGIDGWLRFCVARSTSVSDVSFEIVDSNKVFVASFPVWCNRFASVRQSWDIRENGLEDNIGGDPRWLECTTGSEHDRGWGTLTRFVRVKNGKFEELRAFASNIQEKDALELLKSPTSNWRYVSQSEIKYIGGHFDLPERRNRTVYGLLYRDGDKWIRKENEYRDDVFESYGNEDDFDSVDVARKFPQKTR